MKPPRHPVTVESDMLWAISEMTGLSWDDLADDEIVWFMLQGMRPTAYRGVGDTHRRTGALAPMRWSCQGSCEC